MFRKRRATGLVGRLPLRDVDSNEGDLETPDSLVSKETGTSNMSVPPPTIEKRACTEQDTDPTRHPPTHQKPRGRIGSDSSITVGVKLSLPSNNENHFMNTPTSKPAVKSTNTPNCTYPSVHEHKVTMNGNADTQRRSALAMTPSSTFPVSNPQTNESTHELHNGPSQPSKPPTPFHNANTEELHIASIHRSKSVPQHLSSSKTNEGKLAHAGKPPLSHHPSKQQVSTLPERKTSSTSPPGVNSDIVLMNGQKYKKLSVLGTGGSSKVFKVVGENFQTYALKEVYMKHVDPIIKEAYINEIKLLKRLKHRQEIITLHNYDWDKQEGVLYLLLEYAEMDLNAVIRNWNKANHMVNVLFFWNQMLLVVKVIHEEGVIHNDLKPENFVLIGAGLRLIDFGISKRIEAEKTSFERDVQCGTINYMAPETIETQSEKDFFKVGRPSDIWSLGCILYLMIYGRTPFEHIRNKLKKCVAIVTPSEAIPYPELRNKTAIDIMKKCLCRNPKERPTIDELIAHPFSRNSS